MRYRLFLTRYMISETRIKIFLMRYNSPRGVVLGLFDVVYDLREPTHDLANPDQEQIDAIHMLFNATQHLRAMIRGQGACMGCVKAVRLKHSRLAAYSHEIVF
jgi:hypothetical protein